MMTRELDDLFTEMVDSNCFSDERGMKHSDGCVCALCIAERRLQSAYLDEIRMPSENECECRDQAFIHDRHRTCRSCGKFVPFVKSRDCMDWICEMMDAHALLLIAHDYAPESDE